MPFPSPRRRDGGPSRWSALLALGLALPGAGCCIDPPQADAILDLGFRSPEQTFRTFQTGVRGDLARLEYACLSSDFRARNGLSQLAYREFRDRELDGWVRLGIAEAEITGREELAPGTVRLTCESLGRRFTLVLVREEFVQAWNGDRLLHDAVLDDLGAHLGAERRPDGARELFAIATLPPATAGAPVTELRVGSEWKVDDAPRAVEDATDPPEGTEPGEEPHRL